MTSAIVLNAVGALIIVGGWTLAVLYVYRSLAADSRRPAFPLRRIPDPHAEEGAGMEPAAVPPAGLPEAGMVRPGEPDGERELSLARSAG